MKKIELEQRYTCDECKKFLLNMTEEGYYQIGPNKGVKTTPNGLEIKCICGKIHKFEK